VRRSGCPLREFHRPHAITQADGCAGHFAPDQSYSRSASCTCPGCAPYSRKAAPLWERGHQGASWRCASRTRPLTRNGTESLARLTPRKAAHSSSSRSEQPNVFDRAESPGRRRMLRLTVTVETSPLCSSSTASCCSCRVRSRKSEDPPADRKTPQWVSGGVLSSAHEPPPPR
jgi:hypothetical protein